MSRGSQATESDAIPEVVERNRAEVPHAEMSSLARRTLDDLGFDPGFYVAALRVVARDLPARGIEGKTGDRDSGGLVAQWETVSASPAGTGSTWADLLWRACATTRPWH
ncbi:hypothetical protein [Streptomyces sp. NPDC047028]|uniref:hypothetical protein n=1 Tax=Streptomyces sp. NPDC047028 TaxID=3155793 RepID=UPI003406B38D